MVDFRDIEYIVSPGEKTQAKNTPSSSSKKKT